MKKLSVQAVQQRLVEAEEARKVRWDTMKKNARMHAVDSLNNPSTKITSIKQIGMPKEVERKSDTHPDFVLPAEMAGNYVDKMGRGIFERDGPNGAPSTTPPVTKMRPNQKTNQRKVSPDMQKGRKSETSSSQLWSQSDMAGHYVDAMPRGNIYSMDNTMGGGVSAPSAKNLHGTTRPKSSQKSADLTRWPMKDQPGVGEPSDSFPMPKDAPPKKREWGHVKSGVLVRVNESVKAQFDIVSDTVLQRISENYKRFGYKVVIEHTSEAPRWKSDQRFLQLVHESVAAKKNQANRLHRRLAEAALNRLYRLSQSDFNNLYESREEFLGTLRAALARIMENATFAYQKGLNLFIGKARIVNEGAMHDVEILSEATDHQMALRLIRNKLLENFGLDTEIKFIFVDGTKYLPEQIKEFLPRIKASVA